MDAEIEYGQTWRNKRTGKLYTVSDGTTGRYVQLLSHADKPMLHWVSRNGMLRNYERVS